MQELFSALSLWLSAHPLITELVHGHCTAAVSGAFGC